jgi:hypothetical protein
MMVATATTLLLASGKVPAPLIVAATIVLGFFYEKFKLCLLKRL